MLYICSDHGGFDLKNTLKNFFDNENIPLIDMGPETNEPGDDYPDYVIPTMHKVLENPQENIAIIICKNGVGVSIAANKFKDIRCALSWNPEHAKTAKLDDATNVLALPAEYIDNDTAIQTVAAWIMTEFSNEERHVRRLQKVSQIIETN